MCELMTQGDGLKIWKTPIVWVTPKCFCNTPEVLPCKLKLMFRIVKVKESGPPVGQTG